MSHFVTKLVRSAVASLLLATGAHAAPILKSNVTVDSAIVTVADMFENAGMLAETAIFRAPLPGTTGDVPLETVRFAAERIGLTDFDTLGLPSVRVTRSGVMLTEDILNTVIADHLRETGMLTGALQVNILVNGGLPSVYAATHGDALVLEQFAFQQQGNVFNARLAVSGQPAPLDITGRLNFTIEAPHLTRAMPSGAVITVDDIEMRAISAQLADAAGVPTLEQLLGKQLQRQLREGVLLRTADVGEPIIVSRNDTVTLFLQQGAMTLTVRGTALNNAGRGETVSVLNLVSNRVVQGIAVDNGTVQIATPAASVASL